MLIGELEERRMKELSDSKNYYGSVVKIVTDSGQRRGDDVEMFHKAVSAMGDKTGLLHEAFVAGQAVSGAMKDIPTDVEASVARECIMAERKSGQTWSQEKRGQWIMGYLTNMARRAVIETGRHLVEIEELTSLDKLNVSGASVDDAEDGEKISE